MRQTHVVFAILLWACAGLVPRLGYAAHQAASDGDRRLALDHYKAGQELMAREQFEPAISRFTEAARLDPLLTLAHYGRGQAYMQLRRFTSAVYAYKDCVEAYRLLHGLREQNQAAFARRWEDQLREMRETVQRMRQNPNYAQSLRLLKLEDQLTAFERQRMTAIGGPFRPPAEILLALGSAYFRNEQKAEAEAEWKGAVEINPRLGEAHNNLAALYMGSGRLDEAESELQLAEKSGFRVNPQFKKDLQALRRDR